MAIKRIEAREYVRHAGKIGNTLIRRDNRGTSWMLPDGSVVSERYDGQDWSWWKVTT